MALGLGFNFGLTRHQQSSGGAAAPSMPAFWDTDVVTLYSDPSTLAHLTISDTDKVDALVNAGTAATGWVGTTTARPAYSATSLNGKPGLTFDGSNDVLTNALRANQVLATVAGEGAWGGTIACVVRFAALPSAGTRRDFFSVPTAGYGPLQVRNVAGQGSIVYERGGLVLLSRNISVNTNYLVVWRCNSDGDHFLSVNGGTEASSPAAGDPGGQTGTLQAGGDGGNAGFAACIMGKIWVSKTVAGAADIAALVTYLQAIGELA